MTPREHRVDSESQPTAHSFVCGTMNTATDAGAQTESRRAGNAGPVRFSLRSLRGKNLTGRFSTHQATQATVLVAATSLPLLGGTIADPVSSWSV